MHKMIMTGEIKVLGGRLCHFVCHKFHVDSYMIQHKL